MGFVAVDDIAASALALLTSETKLNGEAHLIIGPEILSHDEVGNLKSKLWAIVRLTMIIDCRPFIGWSRSENRARESFAGGSSQTASIAWCSRPPHCSKPGDKYFIRAGKFKKASNMNYCLDFSLRVEREFLRLRKAHCAELGIDDFAIDVDEEYELYEQARDSTIKSDGGKMKAADLDGLTAWWATPVEQSMTEQ